MLGLSIGLSGQRSGGKAFALNKLSASLSGAWSFRLVNNRYRGPACRVRRSSDNLEADIGFTYSGDLNETALLAHVGAGNGYVTKVYDQSGVVYPNLVTNGDFSNGLTGWLNSSLGAGTASVVNGVLTLTRGVGASNTGTVDQQLSLTPGVRHTIKLTTGATGGPRLFIGTSQSAFDLLSATAIPAGAYEGTFIAGATNWMRLNLLTDNSTGTFDNIEIRECRDLIQSTAASQPLIVNAGSINRIGTRPCMKTDGTDDSMATGAFTVSQDFTRCSVLQFLSTTLTSQVFLNSYNDSPHSPLYMNNGAPLKIYAGVDSMTVKSGIAVGDKATVVENIAGTSSFGSYNGVISNGNAGIQNINGLRIGANSVAANFSLANFSEIIIFPSALSTADRQAWESDAKSYWGTP